jgi:hypothetical protein
MDSLEYVVNAQYGYWWFIILAWALRHEEEWIVWNMYLMPNMDIGGL